MERFVICLSLLLCCAMQGEACLGRGEKSNQLGSPTPGITAKIAKVADKYIGSTKWSYASSHRTGPNTNKCNIFVAEVVEEAGGSVPMRHWWEWSPIGAGEWGNPNSSYLKNSGCWKTVTSPQKGDVASNGVHVAIVTDPSITTSAAKYEVVKNDWGFDRKDPSRIAHVFWRFTC